MSLFVGNISSTISSSSFAKYFDDFGKCDVNFKGSYAFVDFSREKDAEYAKEKLHNKVIGNRKLNIEWAKKSKNYDPRKRRSRSNSVSTRKKCYICESTYHLVRNCPKKRSSRSRSRERRRSKDRRRRHSYSSERRTRSNRRRRSRSLRSRSRSRSRSPMRSRSKSRSDYKRKNSSDSYRKSRRSKEKRRNDNGDSEHK